MAQITLTIKTHYIVVINGLGVGEIKLPIFRSYNKFQQWILRHCFGIIYFDNNPENNALSDILLCKEELNKNYK